MVTLRRTPLSIAYRWRESSFFGATHPTITPVFQGSTKPSGSARLNIKKFLYVQIRRVKILRRKGTFRSPKKTLRKSQKASATSEETTVHWQFAVSETGKARCCGYGTSTPFKLNVPVASAVFTPFIAA